MKELDCVKLVKVIGVIPAGTEGTIVNVYPGGKDLEVEFFDADGNTIVVLTTPKDVLEILPDT